MESIACDSSGDFCCIIPLKMIVRSHKLVFFPLHVEISALRVGGQQRPPEGVHKGYCRRVFRWFTLRIFTHTMPYTCVRLITGFPCHLITEKSSSTIEYVVVQKQAGL